MEKIVKKIASQNYNGIYKIYKLSNNEYACDCLLFLTQRIDFNDSYPFAVCKHIQKYLSYIDNKFYQMNLFSQISEEQKQELELLGVKPVKKLSYNQAEFVLSQLLKKQGLKREEFRNTVFSKFFPLRYYGIEIEGGIGVSRKDFKKILKNHGIKSTVVGYNHKAMYNGIWKLGLDRSVKIRPLYPVELISPKLYGYEGLKQIELVLELWKKTLNCDDRPTNETCGLHIHVDMSGWNYDMIYNLLMIWAKIEKSIIHKLINPIRRKNSFAEAINEDVIENVIQRLFSHSRYFSLNILPLKWRNAVEFRHVEGTIEFEKIQAWVVFLVLLVDTVFNGLTHREISPRIQFDELMDIIGLKQDAVPVIRKARKFLEEKYYENLNTGKEKILIDFSKMEEKYYWNKYKMGEKFTEYDDKLEINSIHNLASRKPIYVLLPNDIKRKGNKWFIFYVDDSNFAHIVEQKNDLLFCSCSSFQKNKFCVHSINIARLIEMYKRLSV